ncbi:MAG: hypothetical protein EBZ48_04585 [Proteobacteria bacterium]|nr:hypothetical protein [Pseudomonadota bacterium]
MSRQRLIDRLLATAEVIAAGVVVFLIVQTCAPVLHSLSQLPSGWDALPHYYLLHRAASYLGGDPTPGFDPNWFAGYPEFRFYPIGGYALLVWLSAILPEDGLLLAFNLCRAFLPLLTTAVMAGLCLALFGWRTTVRAIVASGLFWFPGAALGDFSIGLPGLLAKGLIINFVVLPLLVSVPFLLERTSIRSSGPWIWITGCVIAALAWIHSLSFVCALCISAVWICINSPHGRRRVFASICLTLILAAPAVSQLIAYRDYLVGTAWPGWGKAKNIFTALFPGVFELASGQRCPDLYIVGGGAIQRPIQSHPEAVRGIIQLVLTTVGLAAALERRHYRIIALFGVGCALVWLLPFLIPPDLPLHPYRFLPLVVCAQAAIILIGWDALNRLHLRYAPLVLTSIVTAICWPATNARMTSYGAIPLAKTDWKPSVEQYATWPDVQAVLEHLRLHPLEGRIAIEIVGDLNATAGTPHILTSLIPLQLDIPVVPGLPAEASLSALFIDGLLSVNSTHNIWGRNVLAEYLRREAVPFEKVLAGFADYRISRIIASEPRYRSALRELGSDFVKEEARFGPFLILRVLDLKPEREALQSLPFLYLDRHGPGFLEISELWYSWGLNSKYPLAHAVGNSSQENLSQRFSGVVIASLATSDPSKLAKTSAAAPPGLTSCTLEYTQAKKGLHVSAQARDNLERCLSQTLRPAGAISYELERRSFILGRDDRIGGRLFLSPSLVVTTHGP